MIFLRERWRKVIKERACPVRFGEPSRHGVGILLVGGAISSWVPSSEKRWIDFRQNALAFRYVPAIKWPDVDSAVEFVANMSKPW